MYQHCSFIGQEEQAKASPTTTRTWKTRKFLALTRMLNFSSCSLYRLYETVLPLILYSDEPEVEILRVSGGQREREGDRKSVV